MGVFLHHFSIGVAGAAAFEALKLWQLQGKFTEAKFRKLLKSLTFWIPLLLMLSASGFFAWAYYEGEATATAWDLAVMGITARTLIREVSSAGLAHSGIQLGGTRKAEESTVSLRDVFS